VLNNAHVSNKRKFATYRAMDTLTEATPIIAYPILSKEAGVATTKSAITARDALFEQIGLSPKVTVIAPEVEAEMRDFLEKVVGEPLIDIQELIKDD